MSNFFPSDARIKRSDEFENAFRQNRLTNKWFSIYFVNSNLQCARLGLVVSKRIIAKAVCRNYAKRLIREAFRLNYSTFEKLDFVVKLRRNLSKEHSSEVNCALLQLLLRAKIM